MKNVPDFLELVGDKEDFFRNHFGKGPHFRRGAIAKPEELLSVGDLEEIMRKCIVPAERIAIALNSQAVRCEAYSSPVSVGDGRSVHRVIPEKVSACFRGGATVMWRHMHLFSSNLRRIREIMAETLAARCDTYAFHTPPGFYGLPIHDDPDDVFALQLEGRKRWRIWQPQGSPRLTGKMGYSSNEVEVLGEPVMDVILEPGDFLYIPRHAAHETQACDVESLHATVAVRLEMWSQILLSIAERVMNESSKFTNLPLFAAGSPSCESGDLRTRVQELVALLDGLDFQKEFEQMVAEGKNAKPISGW
ncbi:cupin domain-containing protein [Streptomyces sp. NPDC096153]|uniref:JmjC domain-containing protein n=1 Tax=Streptomyces sp. NPDC096153 TaxID=3155548 RepID=UPI00332E7DD3